MDTISKMSVVIVAYRRNRELLRCMDSCCRFIDFPFEIIVVDNGCEDECKAISERFAAENGVPVTYFCPEKNLGVSGGRNIGASLAKSDVLYFLDDDAWIVEVKGSMKKIVEDRRSNLREYIFSNPVHNINYDVWMRPPKYCRDTKILYFCGASHFVFIDRLPDRHLYPDALFYGHEDLNLSLDVWALGGEIGWTEDLIVWHSSGGKRGKYEEERFYAIGNKYAVRAAHFPKEYQVSLLLGLVVRCVKFWRWKLLKSLACIRYGLSTKRKIRPLVRPLSPEQSRFLIDSFGKGILTEISHTGSDERPPSKTVIYQE